MQKFRLPSCAANTRSMNRNSTNGTKNFWKPAKNGRCGGPLEGDLTREATTDEVSELRKENARLKEMAAAAR